MSARPIHVKAHAIDRARQRCFRDLDLTGVQIRDLIAAEVRQAIDAGRVAREKPKAWRLYREKAKQLPEGGRFVWNAQENRGWFLSLEQDGIHVLTTVHRATQIEEAA